MIYKIKKGHHSYQWYKKIWSVLTSLLWRPTQIAYKVRFTDSCRFDTPKNPDQLNKLFGMSFGILPVYHKGKWYKPHHWNSIRICWDWNKETDKINLYYYEYYEGRLYITNFDGMYASSINKFKLNPSENYIIKLNNDNDSVYVYLMDENSKFISIWSATFLGEFYSFRCKLGYKLYPYIGGKEPAPQDCEIELIKVNGTD